MHRRRVERSGGERTGEIRYLGKDGVQDHHEGAGVIMWRKTEARPEASKNKTGTCLRLTRSS